MNRHLDVFSRDPVAQDFGRCVEVTWCYLVFLSDL